MRTRTAAVVAAAVLALSACQPDDGPDETAEAEPAATVETEAGAAPDPDGDHDQACAEIDAADDAGDYIKLGLELEDADMVQAILAECPEYEEVMMAHAKVLDSLEELGE